MKVLLVAEGKVPLLMHNERLADPLDEYTRAIAKISAKRSKTEADHLEIARLEFEGGMYANDNGPCIPGWNMLRCLQEAAKRTKKGKDILRGVVPLEQSADLAYEGPREPEVMWKEGGFSLRKGVGISRRRVMRTRPIFDGWSVVLPIEVDATIFDPDVLSAIWRDAGVYEGLGDMRPIYGRFIGSLTEWPMTEDDGMAEAAYALACAVRAGEIRAEDIDRSDRHGTVKGVIEAARKRAAEFLRRAEEEAPKD